MPRLPRISGKDVVRKLKEFGFEVFDQSGSHVYLHKWDAEESNWYQRVTVPVHGNKILKLGTLKSILRQSEISVEQFVRYNRHNYMAKTIIKLWFNKKMLSKGIRRC